MSEYQYYEFLAIDHPLDAVERSKMRSLSTRARITATSFVNEYHWGDFRGDPRWLTQRYYDAHLYVANWSTHRVMLRLPDDLLDPRGRGGTAASASSAGEASWPPAGVRPWSPPRSRGRRSPLPGTRPRDRRLRCSALPAIVAGEDHVTSGGRIPPVPPLRYGEYGEVP